MHRIILSYSAVDLFHSIKVWNLHIFEVQSVFKNASETFTGIIWSYIPKTSWVKQLLKSLSCRTFWGLCHKLVRQCDCCALLSLLRTWTLMLLVNNFANTKWRKKAVKWLKPWHMGTHLRVRDFQWIPTWQGLDG